MIHREWMTLIFMMLAFVFFVCGIASFLILPPIIRIVVGMLLFIAAVILGFISLEFLPQNEEGRDGE